MERFTFFFVLTLIFMQYLLSLGHVRPLKVAIQQGNRNCSEFLDAIV